MSTDHERNDLNIGTEGSCVQTVRLA